MTLTEYLNQKDPVYMPHVILQEGEYILGAIVHIQGSDTLTQVFIDAINACYVRKGDGKILYTQDEYGNPKAASCFNLG